MRQKRKNECSSPWEYCPEIITHTVSSDGKLWNARYEPPSAWINWKFDFRKENWNLVITFLDTCLKKQKKNNDLGIALYPFSKPPGMLNSQTRSIHGRIQQSRESCSHISTAGESVKNFCIYSTIFCSLSGHSCCLKAKFVKWTHQLVSSETLMIRYIENISLVRFSFLTECSVS